MGNEVFKVVLESKRDCDYYSVPKEIWESFIQIYNNVSNKDILKREIVKDRFDTGYDSEPHARISFDFCYAPKREEFKINLGGKWKVSGAKWKWNDILCANVCTWKNDEWELSICGPIGSSEPWEVNTQANNFVLYSLRVPKYFSVR